MKKRTTALLALSVLGVASIGVVAHAQASTLSTPTFKKMGSMIGHKEIAFTAIEDALKANDFAAFKTAITGMPLPAGTPEITEALFAKLVEAEKLKAAGDFAGAKKVLSDAGIQMPFGHHGGGQWTKNLTDAQKTTLTQAHDLMKAGKIDEAKKLLSDAGIQFPVREKGFGGHHRMMMNAPTITK